MSNPASSALSLTSQLAHIACRYAWSESPDDVRRRILLAIRDTLSCGVAGALTPLAEAHRAASGKLPGGKSTLIGAPDGTSAQMAAFHNATAINAMDFDDTLSVSGHPGAPVLAAALAVAEQEGARGVDLLDAVLTGYEVSARVAAACRPTAERYALVHGSQCFLGFGAVASAGRILKFDAEQMARAFGIVAAYTPIPIACKFGWDEQQLSWIKDNVNWPAEAGVRAAYLARSGFPATKTVFDGESGFWQMIASDSFDAGKLVDGANFHVRDLGFKLYPCCRWIHGSLDACAQALAAADHPDANSVRKVRVYTTGAVARSFGSRRPATMIDAQYSVPHAIAALCLKIPCTEWWKDDARNSMDVRSCMDKVTLAEDPDMTARFLATGRNANRIPARVVIDLNDGRSAEAFCDVPSGAPGQDEAGQASDELMLEKKHQALLSTNLDRREAARLMESVERLPDLADIGVLTSALRARPKN